MTDSALYAVIVAEKLIFLWRRGLREHEQESPISPNSTQHPK